jgi:aspartyl-tRNA synthetase
MDKETEPKELSKSALKKLAKEKEKEARKAEVAARLAAEKAAREAASVDISVGKYGKLPMNQSAERSDQKYLKIAKIIESSTNMNFEMIARVHSKRPVGAKMLFLNLRQRLDTIQSILTVDDNDGISKQMLKFAAG